MVLYFFLGVFAGLLFGLIPGMHSNTIISILAALGLSNEDFSLFILGLFPAHIVSSFIPSIFFGIPDQRSVLSALAGQRMVLEGKGLQALKVVLLSCVFAALFSVVIFPFALGFLPSAYSAVKPYLLVLISIFCIFFILRARNAPLSLVVFVFSGLLGYYSFNAGVKDAFLPLFSGMFAMGGILTASSQKIPEQKEGKIDYSFVKFAFFGTVAGLAADLFPGISSPSMVAAFVSLFIPIANMGFLASISAIATSEALFSLATSAAIGKSRMGATAVLSGMLDFNQNLPLLLLGFLASIAIASLAVFSLRKTLAGIANVDLSFVNVMIALYLAFVVFAIDGFTGIIIFILASATGYITVKLKAERTNLMGSVIVPTMLLLAGVSF